jgi:hypothetical protein
MDAYDIYHRIKHFWSQHCDRQSGILNKDFKKMPVVVWTPEGYREIVNIKYDENLKAIVLIKDKE